MTRRGMGDCICFDLCRKSILNGNGVRFFVLLPTPFRYFSCPSDLGMAMRSSRDRTNSYRSCSEHDDGSLRLLSIGL